MRRKSKSPWPNSLSNNVAIIMNNLSDQERIKLVENLLERLEQEIANQGAK